MFPHFEERHADSPFVERIWKTRSEKAGSLTSISTTVWSMVIAECRGRLSISLHGPETGASCKTFPDGAEWFGIIFKLGTFVPDILPGSFIDRHIVLPDTSGRSFSLGHSTWQVPTYENADTFVNQLVRAGILVHEPITNAVHQGRSQSLSLRMVQYRFRRSTGLSQRTIRQIQRARYAAALLKQGASIFDTVCEAGYSDQPHLTRSLKHFIGLTPAEIPSTPIIAL
ncbi:MAG: helix-turn-helix domain-containing protein [Anaerolineaceae bacterium]|nr:helix-turn-helix domain-containing protein [Anaerolineaceae bacterium]